MKTILFLILVLIIIALTSCDANRSSLNFVLKKQLGISIDRLNYVYIDSQNIGFSDIRIRRDDHWAFHVFSEARAALRKYDIHLLHSEESSEIKIDCNIEVGRGFPRFGRHFNLITEYIEVVNIRVIDLKEFKVIGEVQYKRPSWFSNNPPYLI